MSKTEIILRWGIVIAISVLGMLACLNLKLKEDAVDLLPGEAVRGDIARLQKMGLVDRLFITLTVSEHQEASPENSRKILLRSVDRLSSYLKESGQFTYILARLPQGYEFSLFSRLHSALPLLLDSADREAMRSMVTAEGIAERLDKSFALLNSPTGIGLKNQIQLDPLGFVTLVLQKLNYLRSEYAMNIDDGYFISRDGKSCLMVAESRLSLTDSQKAATIEKLFEKAAEESLAPGVTARIIGSMPHTLANSRSIQHDLQYLLPVATTLLFLLLIFALRDVRALVVFAVPMIISPPAIALTRLCFGDISGISLGFGIVLLGITVDYPIYLYVTLRDTALDRRAALFKAVGPLSFAALTSLAVFFVMLYSQVAAHRQMGLLSVFGVLLALIFTWLVIPTLSTPPARGKKRENNLISRMTGYATKHAKALITGWLCFLVLGMVAWPQLHYNGDLRVLDAPDKKVVDDEHHFSNTWGKHGEQAFIIAEGTSLAESLDRNSAVYNNLKSLGLKTFQSVAPILPGPATQRENLSGWQDFWRMVRPEFDRQFTTEAVARGFAPQAFKPFFAFIDREPEPLSPQQFLGGPLEPLFAAMVKEVLSDGKGGDKSYLAMTNVAIDKEILPELIKGMAKVPGVSVLANLKWRADVERLLQHDILTLSLWAGLIIVVLVALQYRSARAVTAALAPVISALAAMAIYSYLAGGQLNMMHLIMGIMIIGLSGDYGIFMVSAKLGGTTSAQAVSLCVASTLIGFGVLAFASHPALQALGSTVLVGVGVAWPVALFVSPAILSLGRGKCHA